MLVHENNYQKVLLKLQFIVSDIRVKCCWFLPFVAVVTFQLESCTTAVYFFIVESVHSAVIHNHPRYMLVPCFFMCKSLCYAGCSICSVYGVCEQRTYWLYYITSVQLLSC